MNRHIRRLKAAIKKVDGGYHDAAKEIEALMAEGWTYAAIGREIGRSGKWVRQIVDWATDPAVTDEPPFQEGRSRPEHNVGVALRKGSQDRVDAIVRELPKAAVARVAAAAHRVSLEHETPASSRAYPGMTREGERNARAARKSASSARELTTHRVVTFLLNAASEIRRAVSAIRDGELLEPEVESVKGYVVRVREALESIEHALDTDETVDWDRALAELEASTND